MNTFNYNSRIAGAKTTWIIQFKTLDPDPSNQKANLIPPKPNNDFFIPLPGQQNQWILGVDASHADKALESLNKIEKLCDDIKKECQHETEKPEDVADKAKKVTEELSTLDTLIKHFNELMKRFKNLPPEEKKDLE